MDCREAKKKLTRPAGDHLNPDEEKALREHLNRCPACARLALADRLLADDIELIRDAQPPRPMTVEQVHEAIAFREERHKKTRFGVRIMRQVSNTIYTRPRLSLAAAVMLVLLPASVLVPVKTEISMGYQVAFAAPSGDLVLCRESAEKMLSALQLSNAYIAVTKTDSEAEYIIEPLEDTAQVQRLTRVLDSLGSRRVRSSIASGTPEDRTIWQLLFRDDGRETDAVSPESREREYRIKGPTDLKQIFKDDFTLWLPSEDKSAENLSGLLMNRHKEKTTIWLLGEGGMEPDNCGWDQLLNNSVLKTETPDGEQATFKLYEIQDVRRLEKMGYNFATMEWGTPGQIPIPGMGPRLNEITPNPFTEETVIEYMIPQAYEVQVQILDEDGREVQTLLNCMPLGGIHQVSWSGLDAEGNPVESGTYLCRFTAGDYEETQEIRLER